eukprot:CAMPEP_0181329550 /NCGR_PEP_ID=MMETSP1101-20121128/23367_1 /TAXON_ID=46948 /ORGANISM="Rhodomonas abbreviata, Strain Caron Lab Isolate" /LENGTH=128 /DNA_ID=CAMNT_0023438629 /DNA_START=145 /DNA_END=531 /DNA_ORIENTATION=-
MFSIRGIALVLACACAVTDAFTGASLPGSAISLNLRQTNSRSTRPAGAHMTSDREKIDISRRSFTNVVAASSLFVMPRLAFATEETSKSPQSASTSKPSSSDGDGPGMKECDTPPKPKGEPEVCEVDY